MKSTHTDKDQAHIDWREMRERLAAATAKIERGGAESPEETKRVLKARARELAKAVAPEDDAEYIEIVEFQLAYEQYAVETRHVREVYPLDNLALLPCTPDFVLGVVNIRGEIVSLVDIKKFFNLPERGITNLDKVIVLESNAMVFGILADDIGGVRRLAVSEMRRSRPLPAGIHEDYVQGITATGLAVLDAGALLADKRIVVQENVFAPGSGA